MCPSLLHCHSGAQTSTRDSLSCVNDQLNRPSHAVIRQSRWPESTSAYSHMQTDKGHQSNIKTNIAIDLQHLISCHSL